MVTDMITENLFIISEQLGQFLRTKNLKITTVESCTGGGIAAAITEVAGSSDYFDYGFVTYSNQAKHKLVGVQEGTLEKYGAVSEPVVAQMVTGAIKNTLADIAISVSGIAGPGGGTPDKPVGTVCFGFAFNKASQFLSSIFESSSDNLSQTENMIVITKTVQFSGNRSEIRDQASLFALEYCFKKINSNYPIDTV